MYLRFKLFSCRIVLYIRKVKPVLGVNSTLKTGLHIPMFEYDHINFRELLTEIRFLQELYRLGDCHILSTGRPDSYHVYYLSALSWRKALQVCATSQIIDLKHLGFSISRGHFTLRLSRKGNRKIDLTDIIKSSFGNTADIKDLQSYVIYETAVRV